MKRMTFLMLVFLLASLAFSQTAAPEQGGLPPMMPPHGAMEGRGMGINRSLMKVVTGAPYSADITDTLVQTLRDGNTIQRTTTGKVARDAQGRTYLQETIKQGPFTNSPTTLIFITDPVAGYAYTVHSGDHTANKRSFKAPPAGQARSEMRRRLESENVKVVETNLGTQSIGGVKAEGKSITRTIQAGAI